MVEVQNHPTRHRTTELLIAAVSPFVVIATVIGVGLLMQHNLKVGMAVALSLSAVGCFAISAFLALGWIELSIRGRFTGRILDRVGMVSFAVGGILLGAATVFGLLK